MVMEQDTLNAIIATVVAIVFILGIGRVVLLHSRSVEALLKKTARVPVVMFPEGAVGKMTGKLSYVGEPLTAPITQRRCACYHILVQEPQPGESSRGWRTVVTDEGCQDFLLIDDTGKALVKMSGARIAVTKDRHFNAGYLKETYPGMEEVLKKHGYTARGLFGIKKALRYKEGILEEGEEVAVRGVGRWQDKPGGKGERLLIFECTSETTLAVSDDEKLLN